MTTARDYRDFLADMIRACRSILQFTDGLTLDGYLADEKTRYAVVRAYEILGEAVRYIPDPIQQAHVDIPWRTMASVRNRIVHGYFGIDGTILFTTIEDDIKPLLPRLEALARSRGVPE